ncbi:hypothetical protein Poly30_07910 [Planctomycetes bacterium Poly30]|uniref:Tetratricopeptide repeat protein n=1 Tax=Saltatorellus ferox TaxID=2528018 RepID=A0A518EMH7_9BACT|nr:hypothetical protein Poly30_07910 [Planctomycetes bacterium Poly30]
MLNVSPPTAPTPPRGVRTFAALLLGAAFVGCQSYNDRVSAPLSAFERGDFAAAEQGFANTDTTGSAFLSGAEAGMAAFVEGDFEAALSHFHRAQAASESIDDRAALGLNSLRESIATLALNEGQADYDGEGYERVMLHAMLGMSYLAQGRAEDVLVEARRVDEILTTEEELYETEYAAGGIGHLLSALAYELIGKPGEAYIDYQRLADKNLGGSLVSSALLRLAKSENRRDDLARFQQQWGEGADVPKDWPSVVVIAGLGIGPAKQEFKLDIPLPGGVFSMAVPKFAQGRAPTSALELGFPETSTRVRTSVVENVSQVARKNLDDRIALITARSAGRGLLKRQLADQMRDNKRGTALGLLADVFTVTTERADLRAWRTLPDSWAAARAFLPPNEPTFIQLSEVGGATVDLGTYQLLEGETMFVLARALDSGLVAHVVGGERIEPATAAVIGPASPAP